MKKEVRWEICKDHGSVKRKVIDDQEIVAEIAVTIIDGEDKKKVWFEYKNGKVIQNYHHPYQPKLGLSNVEYGKIMKKLRAIFSEKRKPAVKKPVAPTTTAPSSSAAIDIICAAETNHYEEMIDEDGRIEFKKEKNPELFSAIEKAKEIKRNLCHRPLSLMFNQAWQNALYKAGIRVWDEGWLGIRVWYNSEPRDQKRTGINAAIRMQNHILDGYAENLPNHESELSKLKNIEDILDEANKIYRRWKEMGEEEKNHVREKFTLAIMQLEKCHNENKVRTRKKMAEATEIEDILGRINPGAKAAQTIAAINALHERLKEIGGIYPIIALRREVLLIEKIRLEERIKGAVLKIDFILKHSIFGRQNVNSTERIELPKAINQVLYFFNTILISPYYDKAKSAKKFLEEARQEMSVGNFSLRIKNKIEKARTKLTAAN